MKCFQTFLSDTIGVDGGIENSLVLSQHILPVFPEEKEVEGIDEVLLDERLEAKHRDLIGVF